MAPAAVETGLGPAAAEALVALEQITSVNSPAGKAAAEALSSADAKKVMAALVDELRKKDWTKKIAGIHGALVLALEDTGARADLAAFVSTLDLETMHQPTRYLLNHHQIV